MLVEDVGEGGNGDGGVYEGVQVAAEDEEAVEVEAEGFGEGGAGGEDRADECLREGMEVGGGGLGCCGVG